MSSSTRAGSPSSGHAGAGCWLPAAGIDTKSAAWPVFAKCRCRLLCGLIGLANVVSLCPLVSLGHTNGWVGASWTRYGATALAVAWVVACTSRAVLLLPAVSLPYGTERKAIAGWLVHRFRRSGG